MRRKDREVCDLKKIKEIIEDCYCCRLGLYDEGSIYIVPVNFGYKWIEERLVLYFHGAKEGHKIDLMKKNQRVGFEMDTYVQLCKGKNACQYSSYFQSIIGEGFISFIEENLAKREALSVIMNHYVTEKEYAFSNEMIQSVCVYQLTVDKISCKEHI